MRWLFIPPLREVLAVIDHLPEIEPVCRRTLLFLILLPCAAPALAAPSPNVADGILEAQILLDRQHLSPGVIDGRAGGNTRRAIAAFEQRAGLPVDGELDAPVMAQLRATSSEPLIEDHVISAGEVSDLVHVPPTMEEQSALDHLGFETAAEALAEKYHMSQGLLERLNPGAAYAAGETIRVARADSGPLSAKVTLIEVDKARAELRAFGEDGALLASYPATIGSDTFPSPSGTMEVQAVAPAPTYYFDPAGRDWGPERRLTIAAGPNNPVGGTWIDLTKDGYGIHGSPDPRLIGKTASHGCVRLTNWDAAELGAAVAKGATVTFL